MPYDPHGEYELVKFWNLRETTIARVSEKPESWYLDAIEQAIPHLRSDDPKRRENVAMMIAAYAQMLHVRIMDDLTKDAPGRKLKPAGSGTGKS